MDYVMHAITFPWALAFAVIPPTSYFNGLATFFVALSFTGGVTVLIGDIAALFGCVIGLSDTITAITFVALGTSLPDTFASKAAAIGDDTADAAVGNVTGSNAVNVFLGLGLPWLIACLNWQDKGWEKVNSAWEGGRTEDENGKLSLTSSVTWAQEYRDRYGYFESDGTTFTPGQDKHCPSCQETYPEGGFIVPAGSLGTSVIVFCSCAMCCFALLAWRRKTYGCELGGPPGPARVAQIILTGLWITYIAVSWIMDASS